jgi:hypothetical protein
LEIIRESNLDSFFFLGSGIRKDDQFKRLSFRFHSKSSPPPSEGLVGAFDGATQPSANASGFVRVAQPGIAELVGLPGNPSADTDLSVKITGNTVTGYIYGFVEGASTCNDVS